MSRFAASLRAAAGSLKRCLQPNAANSATNSTQPVPDAIAYTYDELYPRQWRNPIFNHPNSFWDESYGTALDAHPAGKIVVFGFPKSGNVWLKSLLVDYFNIPPIDPMADIGKSGCGITHLPFSPAIAERNDFLHGVCIVRDPRQVLVSFYHYTKTDRFRSARPEFHYDDVHSFYYDWFLSRPVPAYKLNSHSERYARLGVPVVRYEQLRQHPERELERLLLRWGFEPDPAEISRVIAANDLDKLRKEGKSLEKEIAPEHFREGAIATFAKELPDDILRDVEWRFSRCLRRWGYQ
jgi:sulfotransferase family protein